MAKDSGGRGSPICLEMTVQMASSGSKADKACGIWWHVAYFSYKHGVNVAILRQTGLSSCLPDDTNKTHPMDEQQTKIMSPYCLRGVIQASRRPP